MYTEWTRLIILKASAVIQLIMRGTLFRSIVHKVRTHTSLNHILLHFLKSSIYCHLQSNAGELCTAQGLQVRLLGTPVYVNNGSS